MTTLPGLLNLCSVPCRGVGISDYSYICDYVDYIPRNHSLLVATSTRLPALQITVPVRR